MRTSYVPKNKPPENQVKPRIKTEGLEVNSEVKENIVRVYVDLKEQAVKKRELDDYENISKKIKSETSSGGNGKEPTKKSKKKFWIIFSIVAVLVVVGVIGTASYFIFFNGGMSSDSLEVEVSKLYTSSQRLDIKDSVTQETLTYYYNKALELKKKHVNVTKVENELDTIGYFLQDKGKLATYQDLSYDLSNPIMLEDITKIRENTKEYNVSGLAVSITEMTQDILNSYNSYIELKNSLESVSDVLNFNEEEYKKNLDGITHIPNKTELEGIYNKLVADKKEAKAKEEVKQAKNNKAKKKAEKALKEAQKLQKQTNKELESIKKKLNEVEQQTQVETQTMQVIEETPPEEVSMVE